MNVAAFKTLFVGVSLYAVIAAFFGPRWPFEHPGAATAFCIVAVMLGFCPNPYDGPPPSRK
jgi:hypothetical protein